MRVIACQLDSVWEDKPASHARTEALLAQAQTPPGSLFVLPEMFATGFSLNVEKTHEGDGQPSERFLAGLARRHGAAVMAALVTQDQGRMGRNDAVTFGPDGSLLARYSKLHPFTFGGESKHFRGGDKVVVFDWQGWKIAPLICYDLRFPEAFRHAVRGGAELLVVIANWPAPRERAWVAPLVARAMENQAYVVGVNRCGTDPFLKYSGRSMIIDPRGEVLAEAGSGQELLSADLNLQELRDYRASFPALKDMRADLLGG